MKLVGRAIVLKLEPQHNLSMPAKIVVRNIKEIPDSVSFRLELLKIFGIFLDNGLKDGIFNNFKKQQ